MRVDLDTITMEELIADGGRLLVVAVLQSMPYHEYLQTNHWAEVRAQTMKDCGRKCQVCRNAIWARDVHHFTYENKGHEQPEDVMAVCELHHKMWHENWILRVREEGRKQFSHED